MISPTDTRLWINVDLTLVHLLRRWTNVKQALIQRLMSARKQWNVWNVGAMHQPMARPLLAHLCYWLMGTSEMHHQFSWHYRTGRILFGKFRVNISNTNIHLKRLNQTVQWRVYIAEGAIWAGLTIRLAVKANSMSARTRLMISLNTEEYYLKYLLQVVKYSCFILFV